MKLTGVRLSSTVDLATVHVVLDLWDVDDSLGEYLICFSKTSHCLSILEYLSCGRCLRSICKASALDSALCWSSLRGLEQLLLLGVSLVLVLILEQQEELRRKVKVLTNAYLLIDAVCILWRKLEQWDVVMGYLQPVLEVLRIIPRSHHLIGCAFE